MSNLLLWVAVGDHVLNASGDALTIVDVSPTYHLQPDYWSLGTHGDGREVNGYTVASISLIVTDWSNRLTSSELQVPLASGEWNQIVPSFQISFTNGSRIRGEALGIRRTPESVPEPATLSLLAAGVLGVLAARRRRHVAAKA